MLFPFSFSFPSIFPVSSLAPQYHFSMELEAVSKQFAWVWLPGNSRQVLTSGVSEPVCTAAKCICTFLPNFITDDIHWYLELGHGGSFHTTKTGKLYKSGLCFLPFRKFVVKHLAAHISLLGSHLLRETLVLFLKQIRVYLAACKQNPNWTVL